MIVVEIYIPKVQFQHENGNSIAIIIITLKCLFLSSFLIFQSAALVAVANVYESLDEGSIRKMVLPKIKLVFEKNQSDLKIIANVLQCIERTLDKLDKSQVTRKRHTILIPSTFHTKD